MSWMFGDENEERVRYFSPGISYSINKQDEDSLNSLINIDNKIDSEDLNINYDDFKINREDFMIYDKRNIGNSIYTTNNSIFNKNMFSPDMSKNNVFLKRTYLETSHLNDYLREYTKEENFNSAHYLKLSLKDRIENKKVRTKFLLSKTRRRNEPNTEECDNSNDKNSTGYNSKDSRKVSNEVIENDKMKIIELKKKKEITMKKNREAAQKSRMNRKIDNKMLLEYQNILQEKNKKIENELNNLLINSCKFCENCKKLLFEKNKNINTTPDDINNVKKPKSPLDKKFRIIRTSFNSSLTTHNSRINKYTILTGLLVIVCIIANLFWNNTTEDKPNINKFNERILITNYSDTLETNILFKTLPLLPFIESIKNLPDVIIDEKENKKSSFYLRLIDYFQTNNYTPSPIYNEVKVANSKQLLRKETSPAIEHEKILIKNENEPCVNYNTFLKFATTNNNNKPQSKSHLNENNKKEDYKLKFLSEQHEKSVCNSTTKFRGYFDLDFFKNSSKDETCKYCTCPNIDSLKSKNSDKNSEEKRLDPLFFKMIIPIRFNEVLMSKDNKANYSSDTFNAKETKNYSFFKNLIRENLNETIINEKNKNNSSNFYYEIDCMILDINRLFK